MAGQLLARAVATARDSMELFVPDDALRGDSLVFDLEHVRPVVDADTRALAPVQRRNPAPAFTLPVAPERHARMNGSLTLRYPPELQRGNVQGRVVVAFVVDTAGRAEPRTFRDAHPEVVRSLEPNLRDAYAAFLDAVRDAVRRARFFPAEVGACRVRQLVQLPVSFTLTP